MQVEELKKKLDGKLGRNLYRKLNTGPLGKKRSSRAASRSGSLRGSGAKGNVHRRVSSDSGIAQSKEDPYVGFSATPFRLEGKEREQVQELAAIEGMGIVRSSTGGDSKVRNHIRNHVARMSNHRLMIKPRGQRTERKKSSVLVTSMEDSEENARQLYRQESRVVIEGFMQAPSHKQRVLEKLSSSQVKRISDTLMRGRYKKKSKRGSGQLEKQGYVAEVSAS